MENLIQFEDKNGNKNYPVTDVQCNLSKDSGYIKKSNGMLIQWKRSIVTAGGTQWQSSYYSNHSMGNWPITFKELYFSIPLVDSLIYWVTSQRSASLSNAGMIRCFRPTPSTEEITITIIGVGTWK